MKRERACENGIFIGKIVCACAVFFSAFLPGALQRALAPCAMPFLFFAVGFEMRDEPLSTQVPRVFRRYMLPYVGLSILWLVLKESQMFATGAGAQDLKSFFVEYIWRAVFASGNDIMWPVEVPGVGILCLFPMLFFSVVLTNYFVERKYGLIGIGILICIGLYTGNIYWLPFSVQAALVSTCFTTLGYYAGKYKIISYIRFPQALAVGVAVALIYFFQGGGYCSYWNNVLPHGMFDLAASMIFAVCGAAVFVEVADWLGVSVLMQELVARIKKLFGKEGKVTCPILSEAGKKREKAMDFAKGLGIACMVYAHIKGWEYISVQIIYSFHMPLFVFVSGYFFREEDFVTTLKKKVKGIYLPYFVFGMIAVVVGTWISLYFEGRSMHDSLAFFVGNTYNVLIGYQTWVIWFLLALFCSCIIFSITKKITGKRTWLRWLLSVVECFVGWYLAMHLEFVPWYLDVALVCVVFFNAGYEVKLHKETFWRDSLENKMALALLFFVWMWGAYAGRLDIVFEIYPQFPICIVAAIAGCMVVVVLSGYLSRIPILSDVIIYCGRNTLCILCVHNVIMRYCTWGELCSSQPTWISFLMQMLVLLFTCFVWQGIRGTLKRSKIENGRK